MLFSFYFPGSAASAHRGASRRFKRWSRAFDHWIEHRRQNFKPDAAEHAVVVWRRLARQCGKLPWELTQPDIEQHVACMQQDGLSKSTISDAIANIDAFFHWCDDHRVDPYCPSGFNPAERVPKPKIIRYQSAILWARSELSSLMDLLSRDSSILGRREYAFFLARLSFGVPLKNLIELRWEQVELDGAGAWVRWRRSGERHRLPDDLWQAVDAYLQASGRLPGMHAGKYIFVPLAQPLRAGVGSRAEDWLERQPLSRASILANLKLYGRRAGIAEPKLNLKALRRTVIRMKLDEGESPSGMQVFMDSLEPTPAHNSYLELLRHLPLEDEPAETLPPQPVQPFIRALHRFELGGTVTHGLFSRKPDRQAVRDVLAEDIHGMADEIACLRKLMQGLIERQGDEARLADTYIQAAQRLGTLVTTQVPLEKSKKDPYVDEFLAFLDEVERRNGRPPLSQAIRLDALGASPDGMAPAGLVAEEVATVRMMLRRAYRRAMQPISTGEYCRIVDLYGLGCVRLGRLLKLGGCSENDRLRAYLQESVDEAIRQLRQEWGLDQVDRRSLPLVEDG